VQVTLDFNWWRSLLVRQNKWVKAWQEFSDFSETLWCLNVHIVSKDM
jgi:hypothetical protein